MAGPQGLAGLGYQPEDPWVVALQLEAAYKLDGCDPQELADLLEGVLLLAEGCGGSDSGGSGSGGAVSQGLGGAEGAGAGGDSGSGPGQPAMEVFLEAFWRVSAAQLANDAMLMSGAVTRRVSPE